MVGARVSYLAFACILVMNSLYNLLFISFIVDLSFFRFPRSSLLANPGLEPFEPKRISWL